MTSVTYLRSSTPAAGLVLSSGPICHFGHKCCFGTIDHFFFLLPCWLSEEQHFTSKWLSAGVKPCRLFDHIPCAKSCHQKVLCSVIFIFSVLFLLVSKILSQIILKHLYITVLGNDCAMLCYNI